MTTAPAPEHTKPEGATAMYSLWVPPDATRSFRWLAVWEETLAERGFEPCHEPYLIERDGNRYLVGFVRPRR